MTSARPRLIGLDLLRLLAVALVLGRHAQTAPESVPTTARAFLSFWQRGGWIGVDLFFVLSGFLVSGLLFDEFKSHGRISPLRFYARRAWKIYPAYFVMLAITTVAIVAVGGSFERIQLAAEVLLFQNYVRGLWNHTWSLAVEEHFYVLLPLVCLAVLYGRRRRAASLQPILFVGAGVIVAELALRIGTAMSAREFSPHTHVFATHLRLDSLFFGVMLSYAYHFHTERFVRLLTPWRVPLTLGGMLLFTPAFLLPVETSPFMYTAGYTMLYVGSGMLVVGALLCDLPRRRVLGGLASLGASSYSIYLWHMPVLLLGIPLLEQVVGGRFSFAASIAMYLGGSVAVGVLMAKLVEQPALRLRDRWFPSRSRAAVEVGPRPIPVPLPGLAIDSTRPAWQD